MKKEFKEDVSLQFDSNGNCLTRASNILMEAENGTFVDKRKYESLQKKAEKLKDALLDILNQGNMAMQGHWDATQKMKDTAYEAIKEFEVKENSMSKVLELVEAIENHYKPHEDNSHILALTKIIRLQLKGYKRLKSLVDNDNIKTKTDDDEIEYWVSNTELQHICNEVEEETNRIASGSEEK